MSESGTGVPRLSLSSWGPLLVALGLGLVLLLLTLRWASILYVDLLWFSSEGYSSVFWRQTLASWGARFLAGAATTALVYLNLRIVAASLGGIQIRRRFGDLEIQEQLPEHYIHLAALGAALVCGFWFAASIPGGAGLRALVLFYGPEWGIADPILNRDIAHYVFRLPVFSGLLTFGLVLSLFLFAITLGGYVATGAVRWRRNRLEMDGASMPHVASLAAAFLALLGLRFALGRHLLLLDGNSQVQGIFGYADAMARMPGYAVVAVLAVAAAVGMIWGGIRRNLLPPAAGVIIFAGGALIMGELYPNLVQRFRVEPNELERETPYIEANVDFTRAGFELEGMERSGYSYTLPTSDDWEVAEDRMAGFPIWTRETLLTTFRQVEARFQYYDFGEVTIDRYSTEESGLLPVAVSVREVDPNGIPDPNWQNLHLRERYISGMGAVASHGASHDPGGRLRMFLRGIPPEFDETEDPPPKLRLRNSSVYMGVRPQLHAVINPSEESFLAPDGSPGVPGIDFPEGIELSSLARVLALAWRFQDANLVLASEVQPTSRFVFRRQVLERLRTLAPFLLFPEAPYAVVEDGRLVWVVEGFTHTRHFPLSAPHPPGGGLPVTYIRNSVKATVDAITGEVALYLADPEDPLAQAYGAAFPGLFQPMGEAPEGIRRHFRYSRELLNLQVGVLTRYHQRAPPVFHGQQDRWELATELGTGASPITYRPEYSVHRLPGEEEESYLLTTVLVPQGRRNLAAYLAARWSPEEGGEVFLYDVPVEDQVAGPRQVEALVEQDPDISQQFSLWRQGGSQVWTGHLHLVPVGSTLFYMETVFLAADQDAIPEIRRYIVSDGRRVEMAPTLGGAVEALRAEGPTPLLPLIHELEEVEAGVEALPPADPVPADPTPTPTDPRMEALEALDEAERRLREGDWEGFGRALEQLRSVLSRPGGG